jgi:hypothetical protein
VLLERPAGALVPGVMSQPTCVRRLHYLPGRVLGMPHLLPARVIWHRQAVPSSTVPVQKCVRVEVCQTAVRYPRQPLRRQDSSVRSRLTRWSASTRVRTPRAPSQRSHRPSAPEDRTRRAVTAPALPDTGGAGGAEAGGKLFARCGLTLRFSCILGSSVSALPVPCSDSRPSIEKSRNQV